jgi:hypothetical protein
MDAIDHTSITYFSTSEYIVFQENFIEENKFRKAYLIKVQKITILARMFVAVRLGTASGQRHTPMAAGAKSVTTVGNPD